MRGSRFGERGGYSLTSLSKERHGIDGGNLRGKRSPLEHRIRSRSQERRRHRSNSSDHRRRNSKERDRRSDHCFRSHSPVERDRKRVDERDSGRDRERDRERVC